MAAVTNLSSTRRSVRALRAAERLTDEAAGLERLTLTTARALDRAVAEGAPPYAVAQLSRAHLNALSALLALPAPAAPDGFDVLLAELMRPTGGGSDPAADNRF